MYKVIIKYFSQNLIGVLLGVLTGISINLISTPLPLSNYEIIIIFLLISFISLIILFSMNDKILNKFTLEKDDKSFSNRNNDEILDHVIKGIGSKIYINYILLVVFIGCFAFSIFKLYNTNKQIFNENNIKEQKTLKLLNSVSDSVYQLNNKLNLIIGSGVGKKK